MKNIVTMMVVIAILCLSFSIGFEIGYGTGHDKGYKEAQTEWLQKGMDIAFEVFHQAIEDVRDQRTD